MDFGAGFDGIAKDVDTLISAWPVGSALLVVFFGLMPGSLPLLARRRRLVALVPLAAWSGMFALWFLYYANAWARADSSPVPLWWCTFITLIAWSVLIVDAVSAHRRA